MEVNIKDLHQGENTKFNEAYEKAHANYYGMLERVEAQIEE